MSREHPEMPHQSSPAGLPSKDSTKSFWHTEPSPLLLAHRSTRNLPPTADVVIIGSGITGASIAHHLLARNTPSTGEKQHLDVLMLEAREACWGATGRNGGHCQPLLFETPHDPSIGRFELANFHALQRLIAAEAIDCEFHAQPGVRALYSEHLVQQAAEALQVLETTAPDLRRRVRLVTEFAELVEYRIPSAKGAVVTELAGRMWPYKFVAAVLERLLTAQDLQGSFNLQTLTPVVQLQPGRGGGGGGSGEDAGDGAGWTVQTADRGSVRAKRVVLATNGYTSHLLPSFQDLIVPCRGQMSALTPLASLQGTQRLHTSLGFLGAGLEDYLIQRPDARGAHLMFGGGRQLGRSVGVTDDAGLDAATAAYLRRRLVEVLNLPEGEHDNEPGSRPAEFEAVAQWTGIMGFSRDEYPFVGRVPARYAMGGEDLFMAAGFTGHGMPNTWLCGAAVARAVRGGFGGDGGGDGEGERVGEEEMVAEVEAGVKVRVPGVYLITEERIRKAMEGRSVEEVDRAEMEKGRVEGMG